MGALLEQRSHRGGGQVAATDQRRSFCSMQSIPASRISEWSSGNRPITLVRRPISLLKRSSGLVSRKRSPDAARHPCPHRRFAVQAGEYGATVQDGGIRE
jgi:hypothetical protein